MTSPVLVTTREAAQVLGLSCHRVSKLRREPGCPQPELVGIAFAWNLRDLEVWYRWYFSEVRRFISKIRVNNEAAFDGMPCWDWTGPIDRGGYGRVAAKDTDRAHRWAYIRWVADIPTGLTIDHLCRRPKCVNPRHMEVVSSSTNTKRNFSPSVLASREGRCLKGHIRSQVSAYRRNDGSWYCPPCQQVKNARRRAQRVKITDDPTTMVDDGETVCYSCGGVR